MRFVISLIVLVAIGAEVVGQGDNAPRSIDGTSTQNLLRKLPDLQPPNLSHTELAKRSDLIVIARVLSNANVPWDDEIGGDFGKRHTQLVSNRLRVLSVLKGEAKREIDVFPLEWKPNVVVLTNTDFAKLRSTLVLPNLVAVEIEGEISDYGIGVGGQRMHTIEPGYLLYLRQIDDGGFVAASGQRYSGLSVRRLDSFK